MTTLEQVEARIKKLQDKADALRRQKSSKVIAAIHKTMQEHGLTIADLTDDPGPSRRRGRPAGSRNAVVKASTKVKRVASKQYFNPKTGTTWSGFGRAPEWIVNARDRSIFLVGAQNDVQAPEQPTVEEQGIVGGKRGPAAKKVGTKKVAAKKTVKKGAVAEKATPAKKAVAAKSVPAAKTVTSTKKEVPTKKAAAASKSTPVKKARALKVKSAGVPAASAEATELPNVAQTTE